MDSGDCDGNGMCFAYDVLLHILRLLPWRALAGSRRVCRTWRAIVDAHDLLFPHYFPRGAFPGIFVTRVERHSESVFFAPLAKRDRRWPRFRCPVFQNGWAEVRDSCNGLILLSDRYNDYYVCNPATARCTARLPRPSMPSTRCVSAMFIAFDPAVSLHYEVFSFPEENPLQGSARPEKGEEVPPLEQPEPREKVLPITVYSSRTGQWENREFTPGRCAPGHLYDVVTTLPYVYGKMVLSSEYWHESIYMHCHHNVLVILRPLNGTYDMVELPGEPYSERWCGYSLPTNSVLANYERGVHYVAIKKLKLQVWMLSQGTDDQLGWTPAHEANLNPHHHMIDPLAIKPRVTWGLLDSRSEDDADEEDDGEIEELISSTSASESSWNSDEDNFIDVAGDDTHLEPPWWDGGCQIMGFHPHKCALILRLKSAVVVYHLDTSRVQYLGDNYELVKDHMLHACCVYGSFPYRPCYRDVLPTRKSSVST